MCKNWLAKILPSLQYHSQGRCQSVAIASWHPLRKLFRNNKSWWNHWPYWLSAATGSFPVDILLLLGTLFSDPVCLCRRHVDDVEMIRRRSVFHLCYLRRLSTIIFQEQTLMSDAPECGVAELCRFGRQLPESPSQDLGVAGSIGYHGSFACSTPEWLFLINIVIMCLQHCLLCFHTVWTVLRSTEVGRSYIYDCSLLLAWQEIRHPQKSIVLHAYAQIRIGQHRMCLSYGAEDYYRSRVHLLPIDKIGD